MVRVIKVLSNIFLVGIIGLSLLTVIHPILSVWLAIPIAPNTFFSFDDVQGAWILRIGELGGVDEFEFKAVAPDTNFLEIKRKFKPFPVNWFIDWSFSLGLRSPFFVVIVPLEFPVAISLWVIMGRLWKRFRKIGQSGGNSNPKVENATSR